MPPRPRGFNQPNVEKNRQRKLETQVADQNKKKSGGWFSCFSSTADESKQSNMMSQQQLERRQQIQEIEQYNQ